MNIKRNVTNTYEMFQQVYGERTVSRTWVPVWIKQYQGDRAPVNYDF